MRSYTFNMLMVIALSAMIADVHAVDNLYEKNYKAQNNQQLKSMQAQPNTEMFVSNHKEKDDISMLEKGFDMMGSSGFEAGDVPAELALAHAKSIQADTVLVYSKYGSAKTKASKLEMIKEAVKKGKDLTEADVKEPETQYKYYASYWAKLPQPVLGVHVIKLVRQADDLEGEAPTPIEKREMEGLKIIAVIQDSPAAKAGLMRGDTLFKVNDQTINKPEELSKTVRGLQGQMVSLKFERNGAPKTAQATLNAR